MSDLHGESRTQRLDRALHDLLAQTPEVEAASVVSFDGLPMASALPPSMDEDRVAAMSAALLSLGERAAQGLGRGELSQVYIEGDNGTVFLVSCDDEAVLVAVAAQGAKAGLMLYEVRRAAKAVAAALAGPVPSPVPSPVPEQPEPAHAEPMLSVVAAVAEVPPAPAAPIYELPTYDSVMPQPTPQTTSSWSSSYAPSSSSLPGGPPASWS